MRVFYPAVFISFVLSADAFSYDSVGFAAGFLKADLYKTGESYKAVPLLASFNFKIGDPAYSPLSFVIEPVLGIVTSPENNYEAGVSFLFQYTAILSEKFHPYAKAGAGLIYISQESEQQTDGINFSTHAGIGIQRPISSDTFLNLEYRFRHVSNGGVKKPNSGIDSGMFLAGVLFKIG